MKNLLDRLTETHKQRLEIVKNEFPLVYEKIKNELESNFNYLDISYGVYYSMVLFLNNSEHQHLYKFFKIKQNLKK